MNAIFSDGRPRTGLAWVASLASQVVPTEASDKLTNIRLYFIAPSRLFLTPLMALLDVIQNGRAACTNRAKGNLFATSHLSNGIESRTTPH